MLRIRVGNQNRAIAPLERHRKISCAHRETIFSRVRRRSSTWYCIFFSNCHGDLEFWNSSHREQFDAFPSERETALTKNFYANFLTLSTRSNMCSRKRRDAMDLEYVTATPKLVSPQSSLSSFLSQKAEKQNTRGKSARERLKFEPDPLKLLSTEPPAESSVSQVAL